MKSQSNIARQAILIFVFIFASGQITASAGVYQDWVARYNGPGNSYDTPRSMVIDDSSNLYITGPSYGSGTDKDFATVKYDSNGTELWVSRYDGPVNKYDWATDIAIDSLGNVYVTGESVGVDNEMDYATIKYGPNGNQLWVSRYRALGDKSAYPTAIAVDSAQNVYVTGYDYPFSSGNCDIVTIKYDSDGTELWVDVYNGPANQDDQARDIVIDDSGYIYVGGFRDGLYSWFDGWLESDYIIIKYAPDDTRLWSKTYTGPGTVDQIVDIELDNSGNLHVTGESRGGPFLLWGGANVKYDPDGTQLWAISDYPGRPRDMDIDDQGNIYVCGDIYFEQSEKDYCTAKYDPNGILLWTAYYNGPRNDIDDAYALCADSFGNVYVTGESMGLGTGFDCATVKYDTNGNQLWVERYDGPSSESDWGKAIVLDSSGSIYVTGASYSMSKGYDYNTIKYIPCLVGADIQGDSKVNLADFAFVSYQWLKPPEVPSADIKTDGTVDFWDLLILVDCWMD